MMQLHSIHSLRQQATQPSITLTCERMWSFANRIGSDSKYNSAGFLKGADGITKI